MAFPDLRRDEREPGRAALNTACCRVRAAFFFVIPALREICFLLSFFSFLKTSQFSGRPPKSGAGVPSGRGFPGRVLHIPLLSKKYPVISGSLCIIDESMTNNCLNPFIFPLLLVRRIAERV
jgi:hypothetical protein